MQTGDYPAAGSGTAVEEVVEKIAVEETAGGIVVGNIAAVGDIAAVEDIAALGDIAVGDTGDIVEDTAVVVAEEGHHLANTVASRPAR